MEIDGRYSELHEILLQIREILAASVGREVLMEVLIKTPNEARKVKAFVSMSGCKVHMDKKNGHFVVRVTGAVCCV